MTARTHRDVDGDTQYRFLVMYGEDIGRALGSLWLVKEQTDTRVRECLLRDIVIAYARPFSLNRSATGVTHRLSLNVVPRDLQELHRELCTLRNQLFAHTDLAARRPRVTSLTEHIKFIKSEDADYDDLLSRIDQIEALLQAVHDIIVKRRQTVQTFARDDA